MNEIVKLLYQRKSVRVFEEKEIPRDVRDLIIDCAIQAPTAGNQCLYTMLEITDQAVKDRLAVLCDNQPFIAKAPLVIIFLADCRRWLDSYRLAGVFDAPTPQESDLVLAIADATIAAQNSVVAAESVGVGSCYIGDIVENEEAVRELLNLDKYVFPAAMLVYGYPTAQQLERRKPNRFSQKYLVMQNTYHTLNRDEHIAMQAEVKENYDPALFDEDISKFCHRKYMSSFSDEMRRSVKRYLANFKG